MAPTTGRCLSDRSMLGAALEGDIKYETLESLQMTVLHARRALVEKFFALHRACAGRGRSRPGPSCFLEELPLQGRERLLARLAATSSLRDRQLTADDHKDEPILVFSREKRGMCHG